MRFSERWLCHGLYVYTAQINAQTVQYKNLVLYCTESRAVHAFDVISSSQFGEINFWHDLSLLQLLSCLITRHSGCRPRALLPMVFHRLCDFLPIYIYQQFEKIQSRLRLCQFANDTSCVVASTRINTLASSINTSLSTRKVVVFTTTNLQKFWQIVHHPESNRI